MRRSRKFISMPIISIEEGQQIGTVKTIVIDPEKKEIAALIIEQRGWFKDQKVIPYSKVHSVGGDAITIEKYANVEKQTNLPNIVKLIKDKFELIGSKVVAENGSVLGYVDEFYVDLTNGKITTLEISGRFFEGLMQGKATLDTDYIKTVGKEVLIAVEGAENHLNQIEVGLKGTFKNIKDTSSNIWDSTIQKTKSVTKSINQSFEKKKQKTSESPVETDIINLDNTNDFVENNLEREEILTEEEPDDNSDIDLEVETANSTRDEGETIVINESEEIVNPSVEDSAEEPIAEPIVESKEIPSSIEEGNEAVEIEMKDNNSK